MGKPGRSLRRGRACAAALAALAVGASACAPGTAGKGATGNGSAAGGSGNPAAPTTAPLLPSGDSAAQHGPFGQKFRVQAGGVVLEATVRELVSLGAPPPEWKDPAGDFLESAKWHGVAWRAAVTVKWVSGDGPATRLISLFSWYAGTAEHTEPGDAQYYTTKETGVQSLDDQDAEFKLGSSRVGQEVDGYVYFDVDKGPISTVFLQHLAMAPSPPLAVWDAP